MTADINPRVTVGLPVYNGGRFLAETLLSILAQTYAHFELIISDNASTDETQDICLEYSSKDPRIRYYRNERNLGLSRNYNRLVELASGEYFKWASADDLCVAELLARCVDVLNQDSSVVLAYPKTVFIDQDGKFIRKTEPGYDLRSVHPDERLRSVIYKGGHWANADALSGLIRTKALRKTRLMPDYPGGDKRPLGELSLMGKFFEIPEYLHARRQHSDASSHNTGNLRWMLEFFKGKVSTKCIPTWNLFLDHFITVMSSELSLNRKISLTSSILRCMIWSRHYLLEELKVAVELVLSLHNDRKILT